MVRGDGGTKGRASQYAGNGEGLDLLTVTF